MQYLYFDNAGTIEQVKVLEFNFNELGHMVAKVCTNDDEIVELYDDKQLYLDEHMTEKFSLSKLVEAHGVAFISRPIEYKIKVIMVIDENGELCIKGPLYWLDGMEVRTSSMIPVKKILFMEQPWDVWVTTFNTVTYYRSIEELEYYNERKVVNYEDGSVDIIGGQHKDFDFDDKQRKALENFKDAYKKLCKSGVNLYEIDNCIYAINTDGKSIIDPYGDPGDHKLDVPDQAYYDLDIEICMAPDGLLYKKMDSSVE